MTRRTLGSHGPTVSAIGLGCMGLSSDLYGPADEAESLATVHAALDAGLTLLDTADFYGSGHNELLLRDALRGRSREQVILSGKFGALRDPAGGWTGIDNRPASIKNYLAQTLRRLGTDYLDIYRPARVDPKVPIEDVMTTLAGLVKAGYVRHIGLSEVGADTLRRAHAIHPVCDVQIEYSLFSRSLEAAVLPACRELGVGITAYGVLSRGLLSGHWTPGHARGRDVRGFKPRFRGENLDRNLALVEALRAVAAPRGITVAQAAIAWVLSRGDDIVPLLGARRRDQLAESLAALDVTLHLADLGAIEAAIPAGAVAGARYDSVQMRFLDSEKSESLRAAPG